MARHGTARHGGSGRAPSGSGEGSTGSTIFGSWARRFLCILLLTACEMPEMRDIREFPAEASEVPAELRDLFNGTVDVEWFCYCDDGETWEMCTTKNEADAVVHSLLVPGSTEHCHCDPGDLCDP